MGSEGLGDAGLARNADLAWRAAPSRLSLLVWDNALSLHRVVAAAPGEVIRLHRNAVRGERPAGPISVAQPRIVAG